MRMRSFEFGKDFVLALQLGFELLDLLVLDVFNGLGLTTALKTEMGILEELPLPLVKEYGDDVELVAQVRDSNSLQKISLDDSNLLLGVKCRRICFSEWWYLRSRIC